jgi:uncharacterized delta-60 repeat protein
LNSDGSLDEAFDVGSGPDYIYSGDIAVQQDGKILIGGDFYSFDGNTSSNLARLNTDGSFDSSFDVGSGGDYAVYAIEVLSDGKILIGGEFSGFNSSDYEYLARLNSDGSIDTSFDTEIDLNSGITAIASQPDGKIILAGGFTSVHGVTAARIVRLTSSGAYDATLSAGSAANGPIYKILYHTDGSLVVGGNFTKYNGEIVNHITKVSLAGGQADFSCSIAVPSNAQGDQSVYLRIGDTGYNLFNKLYWWLLDTKGPNKLKLVMSESESTEVGEEVLHVNNSEFQLNFKVSDKYSDVSYIQVSESEDFDGATWKNYDGDISVKLPGEGEHKIYIKTRDSNGNVSKTHTQYVVVDTTPPTLSVNDIAGTRGPTLSGTSEEGSYVKVWVNGRVYGQDSSVPGGGKWEVTKNNDKNETDFRYGTNFVFIESEDPSGNKSVLSREIYIQYPSEEIEDDSSSDEIDQSTQSVDLPLDANNSQVLGTEDRGNDSPKRLVNLLVVMGSFSLGMVFFIAALRIKTE